MCVRISTWPIPRAQDASGQAQVGPHEASCGGWSPERDGGRVIRVKQSLALLRFMVQTPNQGPGHYSLCPGLSCTSRP